MMLTMSTPNASLKRSANGRKDARLQRKLACGEESPLCGQKFG